MENKKGYSKAAPKKSHSYYADLSAEAQRKRLMDALRVGPITTLEARRNLDIFMPAARVHELRHKHGEPIEKLWIWQKTDTGKPHRVARYYLLSGRSQDHGQ